MFFIDQQIGLMAGVRDFGSLAEYGSNIVGLARVAKALKIPVLISLVKRAVAEWRHATGDQRTFLRRADLSADQDHQVLRGSDFSPGLKGCCRQDWSPVCHHFQRDYRDVLCSTDHVHASGWLQGLPDRRCLRSM
jgi:hypothetical protein